MARRKLDISLSGYTKPDFSKVVKGHKDFKSEFWGAMQYAHNEFDNKRLKKESIKYYKSQKIDTSLLEFANDYEFMTLGKICFILNSGGDIEVSEGYLNRALEETNAKGLIKKAEKKKEKKATPKKVVSIQDHLKAQACIVAAEFDGWIDEFILQPAKFQPKDKDPLGKLKAGNMKAGHVRHIMNFYEGDIAELKELQEGKCDQLIEAYSCYTKPQIKKLLTFYENINSACNMVIETSKVTRKPRKRKVVSKEKVVEKLKYKKEFASLGLVSINPIDILGAKELWIYNTKTRKIGKFIALDASGLHVNKASIDNFTEKSVQKRLRKPEEQIKEFKKAGKVALRTYLDKIKAVDTKMKGRLNENHILLKVIK